MELPIPFNTKHRRYERMYSSSFVYKLRFMSPSPVTPRHKKSLNHSIIFEILSKALTQCLSAIICACSRSLGLERRLTLEGSTNCLMILLLVDLPEPCSPLWLITIWECRG